MVDKVYLWKHLWKVEWLVRFGRAAKVGFVVVGLPSWINLDSNAPSGYESGVSFVTGGAVDVVGISLIDHR